MWLLYILVAELNHNNYQKKQIHKRAVGTRVLWDLKLGNSTSLKIVAHKVWYQSETSHLPLEKHDSCCQEMTDREITNQFWQIWYPSSILELENQLLLNNFRGEKIKETHSLKKKMYKKNCHSVLMSLMLQIFICNIKRNLSKEKQLVLFLIYWHIYYSNHHTAEYGMKLWSKSRWIHLQSTLEQHDSGFC